jgi:hypothetical protein
MTNGLAVFLTTALLAALAADGLLNGWQASLFLARKFMDLMAVVTVWR